MDFGIIRIQLFNTNKCTEDFREEVERAAREKVTKAMTKLALWARWKVGKHELSPNGIASHTPSMARRSL